MEGLKAALTRARKGGRPKKLSAEDIEVGPALLQAGTISIAEIAKQLGVNRETFYTYFRRPRTNGHASK